MYSLAKRGVSNATSLFRDVTIELYARFQSLLPPLLSMLAPRVWGDPYKSSCTHIIASTSLHTVRLNYTYNVLSISVGVLPVPGVVWSIGVHTWVYTPLVQFNLGFTISFQHLFLLPCVTINLQPSFLSVEWFRSKYSWCHMLNISSIHMYA